MKGKYSALDVAYETINYLNAKKSVVSNLKLQKLLYFFQGLYAVPNNERLFEENFEAWQYGPVIPSVYREFNMYGANSIPSYSQRELDSMGIETLDDDDASFIHEIALVLRRQSAFDLVEITHNQDPWKDVYNPNLREIEISFDSIAKYFNNNYGK